MTIERLSNRVGLMFQKAFAAFDDELPGEEWSWEMSVLASAKNGTVLYLALMAPAIDNPDLVFSTGIVIPTPATLSQESADSLARTLVGQVIQSRQQRAVEESRATSGVLADGDLGLPSRG